MRTKIALRNLYISQFVIFTFLIFAYFIWFPHSFTLLGGFTKTALMLILVDLVLGPLLVFIVFKENKKYLNFDINVLLAIQIFAFIFGAYSLYLKHPAYAVFSGDRFTLTNVSELSPKLSWKDQIKTSLFSSPKLVVVKMPNKKEVRDELIFNILFNGEPSVVRQSKYFKPLQDNFSEILGKSIPVKKLVENTLGKEKLKSFINQNGGEINNYAYFPLSGNNKKQVIWVFDRDSEKPVGIIDFNPSLINQLKTVQTN